jgi:hypothetical protein
MSKTLQEIRDARYHLVSQIDRIMYHSGIHEMINTFMVENQVKVEEIKLEFVEVHSAVNPHLAFIFAGSDVVLERV